MLRHPEARPSPPLIPGHFRRGAPAAPAGHAPRRAAASPPAQTGPGAWCGHTRRGGRVFVWHRGSPARLLRGDGFACGTEASSPPGLAAGSRPDMAAGRSRRALRRSPGGGVEGDGRRAGGPRAVRPHTPCLLGVPSHRDPGGRASPRGERRPRGRSGPVQPPAARPSCSRAPAAPAPYWSLPAQKSFLITAQVT